MFTWHRISPSGAILDTRRAPDKATAEQLLKGSGSVVSAASWKLDVHRFRPVQTVVTDKVQDQRARKVIPLPRGLIGTGEAIQRLGCTERTLRTLAERYRIRAKRLRYGGKVLLGYTPLQLEALRQCLKATP